MATKKSVKTTAKAAPKATGPVTSATVALGDRLRFKTAAHPHFGNVGVVAWCKPESDPDRLGLDMGTGAEPFPADVSDLERI